MTLQSFFDLLNSLFDANIETKGSVNIAKSSNNDKNEQIINDE